VFSELELAVIVRFAGIGGIIYHHCLNMEIQILAKDMEIQVLAYDMEIQVLANNMEIHVLANDMEIQVIQVLANNM
jgi:hypothetical protein